MENRVTGNTSDTPIQEIRQAILDRTLVPVVGAGVSKLVADLPNWWGAIDDGIRHIKQSGVATAAEIKEIRDLLAADQLIPAAELVRSIMGAPAGEFPSWLAHLFGVQRTDVVPERTHGIDSIINLQCPVIATTNYDKLLSELHYTYCAAVTWQDPSRMQVALREGGRIIHLHGVYDLPDSVVFGQQDYDRIVADTAYQMILGTLWVDRTLLFIGCSFDGLKDPDLSRLLTWARDTFRSSRYKHYGLFRAETFTPAQKRTLLNDWRIQVIEYGADYSDLPGWLDSINPRLEEALATREAFGKQVNAVSNRMPAFDTAPEPTGDAVDFSRYIQFVKQVVQDASGTQALKIEETSAAPDRQLYSMVVQGEGYSAPTYTLSSAVAAFTHLALVGEPGSGKSQLLRQEAMALCETYERGIETSQTASAQDIFRLPVLVSLLQYAGESIAELVQQAFRLAGVETNTETVARLASQGALYLLLDDFDWARPEHTPGLLLALRNWKHIHPDCRMVVTTQRPKDGHRLEFPTFIIRALIGQDVLDFLTGTLGLSEEDALTIKNGLPHDFQDLLSLPLTLKMLALVYMNAERRIPQSRSALYAKCIEILLDRSEARSHILFERSDKIRLLSLTARWMQDNGEYRLSLLEFANLLQEWTTANKNAYRVAHLARVDMLQLRSELQQSELFRVTADGHIEFIHRTFAAYLAAISIAPADLPTLVLKQDWETSLLLWASLHPAETTDQLLELAVSKPILLGAVMRERSVQRHSQPNIDALAWFGELVRHFNQMVEAFVVLRDRRWGMSLPATPLQALVAPRGAAEGYALVWQSRPAQRQEPVIWLDHGTLVAAVLQTRQRMPVAVWLLPRWMIERYHPAEAAYMWMLRALLDMLLLVNWTWSPNIYWPDGVPRPHHIVALLMERYAYYREFIEELPESVKERLPFYARGGFDLVADVREDHAERSGVTYAFLPNSGSDMRVYESLIGNAEQDAESPRLVEGADRRWTAQIEGQAHQIMSLQAETLDSVLNTRVTHQAQKWLRNDLEKYLPGFPPEPW